jgi:uncharacterized protein (DUF362 family)
MLSIIVNPSLTYPSGENYYSPDQAYPEYRYLHISSEPNPVYRSVRELLIQAELDRECMNTSDWNPLQGLVPLGSRVFILCNFVQHRGKTESQNAFWSKCTHGSVLRAVLDYVLLAVGPLGKVTFGNAPVQSTDWKKVIQETGANRVLEFYRRNNIPVQAQDLRMFIATRNLFGKILYVEEGKGNEDVINVDLGQESLLAALGGENVNFRVSDYDFRRTQAAHAAGHHIYSINRALLDSDIVISLPKLKTHEKVGLTCALKGFVGAVAYKDCLAHHRFGSPAHNGDEYPYSSKLFYYLSKFHDWINTQDWNKRGINPRVIDYLIRVTLSRMGFSIEGKWYGNDTAWRMALDIARILMYANSKGEMQPRIIQRKHLVFMDGVLGGEGNGPLSPVPIKSGVLLFSNDVVTNDWVCSKLMGFDPDKLPIITGALKPSISYPISNIDSISGFAYFNNRKIPVQEIVFAGIRPFKPPRGWRGHIEDEICRSID